MKIKKLLIGVFAVLVMILLVFAIGFSETIENIIMFIIGGLSLITLIIASMSDDNKSLLTGIGVLGFAVTFGLIAWSEHNTSIRREKELIVMREANKEKLAEQAKQDSIQHINDSIQDIKDSLQMVEDSKRLYAQEGDSVFGSFRFGMKQTEFDAIMRNINKETNGRISIAGHDFKIDGYRFFEDRLYYIRLKSVNTWVRYYFHDAHEYDDSEGLGTGSEIVERIKDRFAKKYGKPNRGDDWHYTHKDINVRSGVSSKSREGLLSTEYWAIFLTFSNPQIEQEAEKAEKINQEKIAKEKKASEEEYQKKKESFGSGL